MICAVCLLRFVWPNATHFLRNTTRSRIQLQPVTIQTRLVTIKHAIHQHGGTFMRFLTLTSQWNISRYIQITLQQQISLEYILFEQNRKFRKNTLYFLIEALYGCIDAVQWWFHHGITGMAYKQSYLKNSFKWYSHSNNCGTSPSTFYVVILYML